MFYVGPKVCQKILVGIKAYVSSSKISSGKLSLVLANLFTQRYHFLLFTSIQQVC